MSAMEASEFWDIAREAGYDDFQVLACVKREDLGRIFGDGAAEVALVEWEKGQMALEMALFQIGQDGLPMEPPAPSKHSYAAPMSMAKSVARKPFSLALKWPVVAERVPLVSPGHVDISNKLLAIDGKKRDYLEAFWAYFVTLGSFSFIWSEQLDSKEFQTRAKDILFEDWNRCKTLGNYLKTLELWIEFCGSLNLEWRTPDSINVRSFLKQFR